MTRPSEMHEEAMNILSEALFLKDKGQNEAFLKLARLALDLEEEVGAELFEKLDKEPTRSIIFRSAAEIALLVNEPERAMHLAAKGLAGYPPKSIKEELRQAFEKATFDYHRFASGTSISDQELEMVLGTGTEVGHGFVPVKEFQTRLATVINLYEKGVQRNIKRTTGKSITPKEIKERYTPYVSEPKAASFAVKLKFLEPKENASLLENFSNSSFFIRDLVESFILAENQEFEKLQLKLGNYSEYINFISSFKILSPDGTNVSSVSFNLVNNNSETVGVLVTNPKELYEEELVRASEINSSLLEKSNENQETVESQILTLEGQLLSADGETNFIRLFQQKDKGVYKKGKDKGQNKVEKKYFVVEVNEGLQELVKNSFYSNVTIRVLKKDKKYSLIDIL